MFAKPYRRGRTLATTVALTLWGVSCGGSADTTSTGAETRCGPVQRQQAQFPAHHLLPGSAEPRYVSEPPTSGPHLIPSRLEAAYGEPLSRPVQVGVLELGNILLQYRDVATAPQAAALAGNGVVVAPNPTLTAPIVLTGWLYLQSCDEVNETVIVRFRAASRAGTPTTHVG